MEGNKKAPVGEQDALKSVTVYLPTELKELIFHESQRKGYTMKNLIVFILQSHFENTAQQ